MCVNNKRFVFVWIFELVFFAFFIAGILVLAVGTKSNCDTGCIERTCLGNNYRSYSCDCGYYCQDKIYYLDSAYKLGISLLVVGIIGLIVGSVLLCIVRRNYYNNPPQGPIVVAQPVVYGVSAGYVVQPGVTAQGMNQDPNYQPQYAYGQPLNQPVYYGYPAQAQGQPAYQNQPVYQNQPQIQPQQEGEPNRY